MLETKRLKLRNFKDTDIYELFDYRNNQLCAKYQRYDDKSEKALSEFIKRNKDQHFLSETEQHYAITLKTGELIGDVAIYFKKETITLGYTISYKHHRKGYAFEILSALVKSLHYKYLEYEIVCLVDEGNIPSMKLLEKLGFINEGYEEKVKSYIFSLSCVR